MQDFISKIKNKWQTIMVIIFMVVAITFSVSIFIPAKYSSEVKMIVIQNHQSEKVDAFSAAKSAEYLSNIIANIVFTESFIQDMLDAPFEVERNFSISSEKKVKMWKKMVDVKKENNTGILTIKVLDNSQEQAEIIADSISWALNTRGSKYHGGGNTVEIKTIDGPITSEKLAIPNIPLNIALALVIGLTGSLSIVYFFDDFELIVFSRNSRNKKSFEQNTIDQMAMQLENIRKNLKRQKPNSLVMDDYEISQKSDESQNLDEMEKAFQEEAEFVRVIEDEETLKENSEEQDFVAPIETNSKKGVAPKNLPIFIEEEEAAKPKEENLSKGFISMEELNREAKKMGLTDDSIEEKKDGSKYEASSDEVKERLNKLLRGEL